VGIPDHLRYLLWAATEGIIKLDWFIQNLFLIIKNEIFKKKNFIRINFKKFFFFFFLLLEKDLFDPNYKFNNYEGKP
jgi:hypothetical protein